jgi:hypothetical protein
MRTDKAERITDPIAFKINSLPATIFYYLWRSLQIKGGQFVIGSTHCSVICNYYSMKSLACFINSFGLPLLELRTTENEQKKWKIKDTVYFKNLQISICSDTNLPTSYQFFSHFAIFMVFFLCLYIFAYLYFIFFLHFYQQLCSF